MRLVSRVILSSILFAQPLAALTTEWDVHTWTKNAYTQNAINLTFAAARPAGISSLSGSNPASANPAFHHLGISNLTLRPVPKISPLLTIALSYLVTAGLVLRHLTLVKK